MAQFQRPRSRIIDDAGPLPPTPAASPVEPSSFAAVMLQAENTANTEYQEQQKKQQQQQLKKKIDAEVAEAIAFETSRDLPGTAAYTLLTDMQQFLEDEAADKRSLARLDELIGSLRATNDIINKLGRAAHTENNWTLVAVTMKKASDHVNALATELHNLTTFNRTRGRNIERLVRYAKAVSAGAIPAAEAMIRERDGEDIILDTTGHEHYMFHFSNDALAPFEPTERLHLSAFDTAT